MEKDENVKENEQINESEITIENTEGETSNIQIADDVVAIIAGKAVSDAPGVYAMAGGFAGGISEEFGNSGLLVFQKGLKVLHITLLKMHYLHQHHYIIVQSTNLQLKIMACPVQTSRLSIHSISKFLLNEMSKTFLPHALCLLFHFFQHKY